MQRGYSSSRDGLYRDSPPIRGPFLPGGTPLHGLFGEVLLDRVWFFTSPTETGYIIFLLV